MERTKQPGTFINDQANKVYCRVLFNFGLLECREYPVINLGHVRVKWWEHFFSRTHRLYRDQINEAQDSISGIELTVSLTSSGKSVAGIGAVSLCPAVVFSKTFGILPHF
jgi:hypothetical protein